MEKTIMQRLREKTFSRRLSGISAIVLCLMILFATSPRQTVSAQSEPGIFINPTSLELKINDTFTVSFSLSNFPNLHTYQVVFEYNGSVLNLTDVTYPDDSVFSGFSSFPVPPISKELLGGLNVTMVGDTLLGLGTSVDVSADTNATLFRANFTVVGEGQTQIGLVTAASGNADYTFLLDPDAAAAGGLPETTEFVTNVCVIVVGGGPVPPIAFFRVSIPPIDNRTHLIIYQNTGGAISYAYVFKGIPAYFNASGSYAPVGNITAYIWDFGDGNITAFSYDPNLDIIPHLGNLTGKSVTVINATPTMGTYVSHVYTTVTIFTMNLTVVGGATSDTPAAFSPAVNIKILVGVAMEYENFNWLIYTFFGIIVAVIVILAARSVVRRIRIRRGLRKREMLTASPSGGPPTGTQTT